MRSIIVLITLAAALLATPAAAFDLNAYRAQHRLPPLAMSATLAGLASEHAYDMARRNHLDHNGYRLRLSFAGGTAAENVAWGCSTADCAYRLWTRSAGHRRNMLMKGITKYGLASATGANGRTYWVLELGTK